MAGEGHVGLRRGLSRREALRLGAAGLGAVAAGTAWLRGGAAIGGDGGSDVPPPEVARFAASLRVPPLLRPDAARSTPTVQRYTVTERRALQQILPPPFPATAIWGFNGITPGPTIIQVRANPDGTGPRSELLVRNRIPNPTSTHLHGSPTKPDDDGHPLILVRPGEEKSHEYPNGEESRTLWYHDHAIHITAENVYNGLAAQFWQLPSRDDIDRFGLDALPSGYGEYDVPLIIADKIFTRDGRLVFPAEEERNLLGNVVLVNGVPWPRMAVQPRRYRFRILLASVSRTFELELVGASFAVIATDGGLLRRPVEVTRLRIAPAERYEIVVDFRPFRPGDRIVMRNRLGEEAMGDVMRFDVVPLTDEPDTRETPDVLNEIPRIPVAQSVRTRRWRFERSGGEFVINGLPWGDDRVDARPIRNTTEVWEFVNNSGGWLHPVHVHLVDFQILSRNGGPPRPYEDGWKDVVIVGPNDTVRVIMTFTPARDENGEEALGRYVMHCHNLIHEDHDMMTQFAVRGPDPALAASAPAPHSLMLQWELV